MSVILPKIPARLRRMLGRFVGPAGAALFSLVLASCAGGGFGGAPDTPAVNPASQPAPVASGPISPASQRNVAEALSGLKLGDETPPISPEDIAVSDDAEILNRNPFSSSAPAARASGWGARADSTRKTQGYKAFEVAVPSENPLMTVAVWISETPPDYPEGKPEQDPESDRKFLYLRLQVFIAVRHVALVEGGGIEVLDSEVIVVEEKRPDPKPQPACGTGEFRDEEGSCSPILGADLLCPSGTMPVNGLTQAELDAGLLSAATSGDLAEACEHLRRGANPNGRDQHKHVPLMRANADLEMGKLLLNNGADLTVWVEGWWTPLFPLYGVYTSAQIEFYLSRGVDPNFGPWDSTWNPLHGAAYSNKWRSMKLLLDAGADPNIQTTRPGWRGGAPLHYVFDGTRSGSALAVSVLLSGGAEVNARDNGGRSALDLAARSGDAASAEILRAAGGQCFVATGPLCEVVEAATPDPVTLEAVTSETVCESGSLSANGLTQAELDAGLISAARDNDLEGVCEHLRRGANIEAQESEWRYHKRTALMIAATDGSLDMAKLLRTNGADVNRQGGNYHNGIDSAAPSSGNRRMSALHYAAGAGHKDFVEWLLAEGADLHAKQTIKRDALWEAAFWGRVDIVKLFLSLGANVHVRDVWGATPFLDAAHFPTYLTRYGSPHWGVSDGYDMPPASAWPTVLSLLVASGAEVNVRYNHRHENALSSALDVAVSRGNAEYAELLRGYGVRCFVQTGPLCGVPEAVTAVTAVTAETVCESGSLSANGQTQAQLDAGLLSAARDNDLEGACEHLRRGANIEAQESEWRYHKRTALMIAATDGSLDMAKLLRTNGADVNRQGGNYHNGIDSAAPSSGNRRMSALHYAAGAGHKDFVEWLLAEGADLHAKQTIKRDALWEAAFWGRVDIVKLFLSLGANVHVRDVWGATPFLDAAHFPTYLTRYGSPHWGVSDGYDMPPASAWPTVLSLLVASGAEVNVRYNYSGYSALDIAVSRGNAEYAELLRGYGVRCFVQTGPLCGEVQVAVDFSSSGSGTVSAEGDGGALSDGDDVRQGATVMFTATPAAGHYVSGWSGNCAEIGEVADGLDGTAKFCAVSADSDLSVHAEFSEIPSLAGPLCESGSLSTNGLTQTELDEGLLSAARDNDLEGVCEYLRRGANIEAEDAPVPRWAADVMKRTPLVIAAVEGRLELARLLLDNGANVNWQSGRKLSESVYDSSAGWSALLQAAGAGHSDVVELLLDRGADIDIRWDFGRTALHEAAIFGRASVVELLLDRGVEVDARDLSGATALYGAAWGSNANHHLSNRPTWEGKWDQVLDLLLDAGAEVNARTTRTSTWGPAGRVYVSEGWDGGRTPLDAAVSVNKRSRALKLRSHGGVCHVESGPLCPPPVTVAATPDPVTLEAVTAETVCESGSLSANGLTQAELDAGLISAARDNDLEGVCEHLRRGANIEAQESEWRYHKRTALMIAATDGSLDMAKLLRTNGADVNRQGGNYHNGIDSAAPSSGNRRMSALHYAAGAGHKDFVEWLLAEGADLHAKQTIKRDALWEAAFWGRADIVKLFLSLGANVHVRDVWGATPFLDAAHFPTYLTRYGSPHWGVSDGYDMPPASAWPTVLSLLVASGAEVNVRYNYSGYSALDIAVSRGNAEYAELLRGYGVRCFVQTGPLCGEVQVAVDFSSSGSGTVSAEGDGGALSDGDNVRQGATVVFTATPAAGHYVSGWSGNCAEIGTVADGLDGTAKSCAVSADSDLSVRAEFSEIPSLAGLLCPSGSLSANGLTIAELNMTLRLAARGGDATRVCEALRRGAEVNDNLDDTEFTPLQEAVSGGHLEAAKVLLANGAEVNKRKDGAGHSPLDLAARDDQAEIAALLRNADGRCFLETGPLCQNVPVATPDPVTVVNTVAATVANTVVATVANTVIAAVENTVASTVATGSCPAGTLDANGLTQAQLDQAMLDAVSDGDVEEVCEYLRRGANVGAYSENEYPGLVLVQPNDVDMAKLLLENGADPNQRKSILHAPPLWFEAKGVEIIRLYLSYGADPNLGSDPRQSSKPLHHAAYYNNWRVMEALLEFGAEPNVRDTKPGWRMSMPLHFVFDGTRTNSDLAVSVLLSGGADVNALDGGGNSALDLAVRDNNAAAAQVLRDAGGQCFVRTGSLCGSAPAPAAAAESAPATDRLRESFAGAFNPSPAFGDAFGAASGSSERFLSRLDSLMRSTSGSGGNAWDSFAGWQRENEHGRMWFSTGQRGDFGFGAGVGGAGGDLSASPFAAMVGNGMLAGGETGLGAAGKLRIAAFADYQARSLLDGTDRQWTKWAASGTAIETAMTEAERFSGLAENQTRGAMTEIHLGGGDLGVALQAGAVSESDAMLSGTAGDENLRGLRARTAFAGLSGAADLFGSGWRLRGSAHLGRSWAESESMLQDGDLWASAFSAGLERGGWLYSDDGFVLRFSQPLRVESLEMELIGEGGASRLGADPSGRQLDVDAAYRLPLSGGGWLLLSAGVRRDGGHTSSSDLEAGALFSVERGF